MKFTYLILICLGLISCNSEPKQIVVEPLQTGADISIRGAGAVSDSVVWLSGSKSTVLRTIDGGASWDKIIVSDSLNLDFRNIWAFDANTAVVISIGSPAYIFKTIDGGKAWKNVYYNDNKSIFMNSLTFKDSNNGITIGDQINGAFFTLITSDGGDSWIEVNGAKGETGEGGFAASNTCISYLPSGKIMLISGMNAGGCHIANDKDFDWQKEQFNIPVKNTNGADGAYTIYMKNDLEGMIGGGNYMDVTVNAEVVGITKDGGKSWSNSTTLPHGFISCIKPFASGDAILAVGSDGISFTKDFGTNWNIVSTTNGYHTSTSSPESDIIYVAGAKGSVAKIYFK